MPEVHGYLLEGGELELAAKLVRLGQRYVEDLDLDGRRAPLTLRRFVERIERAAAGGSAPSAEEVGPADDAPTKERGWIGSKAAGEIVGKHERTMTRYAARYGGHQLDNGVWIFDPAVLAVLAVSEVGHRTSEVGGRSAESQA